MRHLKSALIALAATAVILFVGSLFLDSSYQAEKSINIKASPEEIFRYSSDLHKWNEWTAWNDKKYNSMKLSFVGPAKGVGSEMNWDADGDQGTVKIKELKDNKSVSFEIELDNNFKANGIIQLISKEESTLVTWKMSGDAGKNFLQKYLLLFIDQFMTTDIETGLANLKKICEKD